MYFGYTEIGRFAFVPLGFVIVMATFVALCAIYLVGASSGRQAAARYLTWTWRIFGVAALADLAFAVASGQLARFVAVLGWSPLFEMAILSFLCIGSMGFMASRYVASEVHQTDSDSEVAAPGISEKGGSEHA